MYKNNYNVYEITSDNGIKECIGKYDTKKENLLILYR
jgi:hypothetical protein